MLAKCVNPSCSTHFRYLENGTLYRLESDPWCSSDNQLREYFWLCRGCAATSTLQLDEEARIRVAPAEAPRVHREEALDFILLDRQKGMLLSRVTLFYDGARQRKKIRGVQLHP